MTTSLEKERIKVGHTCKTATIHVAFSKEVFQQIKQEASKRGLTCSAWLRMKAIEAAKGI